MSVETEQIINEKKQTQFGLSEGVLIGVFSLLGYLSAYYYQLGSHRYYKVPTMYLEINMSIVLRGVSSTLSVLLLAYLFIDTMPRFIPKFKQDQINEIVDSFLIQLAAYGYFMLLTRGFANIPWYYHLAIVGLFFIKIFVLPLLTERKAKGYVNKLIHSKEKQNREDADATRDTISMMIRKKFGVRILRFLLLGQIILVLLPYLSDLGMFMASRQDTYLIMKSTDTYVVLGTYRDQLLVGAVDLDKMEISPKFKLIKAENTPEMEMRKTGQLKVKDPSAK